MLKAIATFLFALLMAPCTLASPVLALPDLGGATLGGMGTDQEAAVGRSIVNEIRRAGLILDDPELQEYIQNLGARLVPVSGNDGRRYHFFLVKDDSINAFALPGGYIGIHTGLLRRTRSESELAGVLAHEIAHVRQNHIARRYEASAGMSLKALAAILGAIAIAASGESPDSAAGALMLGQGLAIQDQINFTRSQESEADRVGIQILADADFDPRGMVSFFQTMQQYERLQNSRMPEFLSTHPLSLTRITEAAQRAGAMGAVRISETRTYPLMRARLAALAANSATLEGGPAADADLGDEARQYLKAERSLLAGRPDEAENQFRALRDTSLDVIQYHIGLARALTAQNKETAALDALQKAEELFPGNIPLNIVYAESLRHFGKADEGLKRLHDLFNRKVPPVETIRFMAQLAAETGDRGESHFLMSEYYLRIGEYDLALTQLRLATNAEGNSRAQRLQYEARLEEISENLKETHRSSRSEPKNQKLSQNTR